MIDQIIQLLYSLLFFVTPLIMTKSTSELFEFNKLLYIYGSTVLIVLFWTIKMIVNKKIILKKTPLDIPIVLFLLSQLISTIFSIDFHTSIFGYYGRFNGGFLSIVSYILLYYGLISNKLNIQKLLRSMMASSILVILWAIPGHFGHDLTCLIFTGKFNNSCWDNATLAFRPELRAFSTLGQPNWLGAYLAVMFFIGIYFLIKNKLDTKYLIANTLYLFLNFSMILFTRSRSAIFSVVIGLVLLVVYYFNFINIKFKKILTILLIVTVIPIILFKTGEDKLDRYLSISSIKDQILKSQIKNPSPKSNVPNPNITESFDIRKIVWEGAWKLAKTYPLFGTGVETFAYSYNFVRPVEHNLTSEWDYVYNKAHNEYFNYLATTGFIGFGTYLAFIIIFIFYIVRSVKVQRPDNKRSILTLGLFCGWITVLVTNFFGFSTTTVQLFFYLIPALIFMDHKDEGNTGKLENLNAYQWSIISAITIFSVYLIFSLIVYYLADVNYSYGLKYSKVNDQQRAVGYFEKALKLRQEPVYMDRFSTSLAYLSALANAQKQTEMAKQIANLSDSYNKNTIQNYPNNVYYWKTRAKNMYYFFQITGNENELLQGIDALKKARRLSPTDPKIPYSISLYSSILYDLSKSNADKSLWEKLSLDEANIVLKLKPNFREGYLFKGQLLKKYGFNIESKKVFEYMLKNFDSKDSEVLNELQSL